MQYAVRCLGDFEVHKTLDRRRIATVRSTDRLIPYTRQGKDGGKPHPGWITCYEFPQSSTDDPVRDNILSGILSGKRIPCRANGDYRIFCIYPVFILQVRLSVFDAYPFKISIDIIPYAFHRGKSKNCCNISLSGNHPFIKHERIQS